MKSAIFLSIREKATRLPKKVLLEIKGKTVTEHLIERLKQAKLPDLIVLCTSTHPDDTILVDIAKKNDIKYFRGSEDDKLDRYSNAALNFGVDFMVIVDGDDIFCDPVFIDETIERFIQTDADFIMCGGLPLGVACSGIKLDALNKVCEVKDETDTEVWGGYFTETGLFKVEYLKVEDDELRHPEIRMTLDYHEDFEFLKAVFDRLYVPGKVFTLKEIVTLLKNNPHIIELNKDVQNAYIENLRKHTKIKLKNQKREKMKLLVIGLGSMGKRRIRNLQYLKAGEIIGFDLQENRCKEVEDKYGIKTFKKFDDAMSEDPDAFIISTPPDKHLEYALIAAENNKHFFTEASVLADGMDELITLCKNKNIVAAPSCTMRFHPAVKKIKELIDNKVIGEILAFTYHSGQYLPDWHPWEDYRSFYVARQETGACREIVPFELTWLTWVLGDIDAISCFKGKLTKLDIEIDDAYQITMKFKSGALGHILVDVISRVPYRVCKLISEEGLIIWDWGDGVKIYTAEDKSWKEYPEESGTTVEGYAEKIKEEPYIEEMDHFVRAIKGGIRYPYTLGEDKEILSILYSAEKSSENSIHVVVNGEGER